MSRPQYADPEMARDLFEAYEYRVLAKTTFGGLTACHGGQGQVQCAHVTTRPNQCDTTASPQTPLFNDHPLSVKPVDG